MGDPCERFTRGTLPISAIGFGDFLKCIYSKHNTYSTPYKNPLNA